MWEETPSGIVYGINPGIRRGQRSMSFASPVTHFPGLVAVGRDLYAPDGASVIALGGISAREN
ncbi:MAG TPA: hypothetical protein VEJ84_12000 [Acidimicrobiales bacterium]|nr:hypothetical protein [Acidimicrobiales bacterium]